MKVVGNWAEAGLVTLKMSMVLTIGLEFTKLAEPVQA